MSTFLERLQVERQELETKTHALETFIDSNPVFETVSKHQRALLITQCSAMQMYLFILNERIADLESTT
jgi:hypothetical protein